jgi:arylformamidase
MPQRFDAAQPRHFGAPPATTRPLEVDGFNGSVARGASCNCAVITLVPHCNGTHTECAGHLTREPLDAFRVVPVAPLPALLLTVTAECAPVEQEDSDPAPQPGDQLITRRMLERAWPASAPFAPIALVVRTAAAPGGGAAPAPYLSRQAAQFLVARGILHLAIDLPSIDREQDQGRLCAHRIFFGLPAGSASLAQVARPQATVTELIRIPEAVTAGAYFLQLQVPSLAGDAVPSRPLLFALEDDAR